MTPDDGHVPLITFTALAIGGAGIVATAALLAPGGGGRLNPPIAAFGLGLLAAGLAVSVLHLGRRDRSHLAARGLTTARGPGTLVARPSAISIEGLLGVAVVALGILALALPVPPGAQPYVAAATGLAAAAFLLSIGQVYNVRGHLTWTGPAVFTPVTGGMAFGAMLWAGVAREPVGPAVVVVVAVDTLVHFLRWRRVTVVALECPDAAGTWFDRRHELLAARFLLLDALPLVSLFVWPSPVAALIAGAGLTVDRLGFYALALANRTETEIARVERHLGAGDPSGM